MGHNKRTCKGKGSFEISIPKDGNKNAKPNGKKSMNGVGQTVIEGGPKAPQPTQE